MPSALVAALAAPIREVQSMVGPGWSGDPATDPAAVLGGVRDALAEVSAATARAWGLAGQRWWGVGADGAADFVAAAASSAVALSMRAEALGVSADAAAAAVARANSRLRDIVARFEARAAELEPHLDSPGAAEELLDEAQRALSEAIGVVDELRAELDGQAASLAGPTPAAPAPTAPAGFAPTPALGSGAGGASPMSPLSSPDGIRHRAWRPRRVLSSQGGGPGARPCHVRGGRGGSVTRRQHRVGAEQGGGRRRPACPDPAGRALPVGRHRTRRRSGLQRSHAVGVSRSGT